MAYCSPQNSTVPGTCFYIGVNARYNSKKNFNTFFISNFLSNSLHRKFKIFIGLNSHILQENTHILNIDDISLQCSFLNEEFDFKYPYHIFLSFEIDISKESLGANHWCATIISYVIFLEDNCITMSRIFHNISNVNNFQHEVHCSIFFFLDEASSFISEF